MRVSRFVNSISCLDLWVPRNRVPSAPPFLAYSKQLLRELVRHGIADMCDSPFSGAPCSRFFAVILEAVRKIPAPIVASLTDPWCRSLASMHCQRGEFHSRLL
jgi:hypothetical protein